MDIKDLAGLSKPLCKLITTFQDGCSWALKPSQIKRIASASSEASSIESNADFKKNLKEALLYDTVNAAHSIREKRQFNNIASIYAIAAQELQMIESVDEAPVDPDWSANFFDYSKDISNEEAQIIWARILSEEIIKSGSIYKRTLFILKHIETFEAKWFASICPFVICDSILDLLLLDYYPYNQIQSLMDCGLLNSDRCRFQIDKDVDEIYGKTHSLKLTFSQTDIPKISLNVFSLTDSGHQLYRITQAQTHQSYMMRLKEKLEQGYKLEIDLVQRSK